MVRKRLRSGLGPCGRALGPSWGSGRNRERWRCRGNRGDICSRRQGLEIRVERLRRKLRTLEELLKKEEESPSY
ncbi:hypothetical protein G4V39_07575 [Thermosulfuriphilus ammonigenes]|uniref:Uncharacterized protein n=1 Tax=Thermosulfuriphilus ammonigenes TaxID=1936021 RepID=A0A6G7PWR4_9BACT|nr:hypothetical protein [Thermosulfuriphilus ammonigenes]MBA2847655.1 hypothetical protein [Thermosulfuriphilus ammonigenes]QIJ72135.1 hypothetical protein G4V39_07575 [Thermosulfuriphilus ammonigenes]